MLVSLHIKNVVLIESLSLEFADGLSALTGETGAGKSILLDSLGLALGARAESSLVRRGADQASVSAEFDLGGGHPVLDVLKEQGIEVEDQLILKRVLGSDGRSRAFINNETVSVGFLKTVGDLLVDIHGQFETYGLLNPSTHRSVLDQFAGHLSLVSDVSGAFRKWRDEEEALAAARADAERASRDEEYLRACVAELDKLAPAEGEEADLVGKKKQIQHIEAIGECFSFMSEALAGERGADMLVGQAARTLERNLEKLGEATQGEAQELLDSLARAGDAVQESCRLLEGLKSRLDFGDLNIEEIEDRLYALRAAARKHHCSVEELPALLAQMSGQLEKVDRQSDLLGQLERAVADAKDKFAGLARKLHDGRVKAGKELDKIINAELKPLKLDKAVFKSSVEEIASEGAWNSHGTSDVRFLVATNAGTDFGALNKIASGGEMARFMLALKVVLAERAVGAGVYVFDEIDTGIGGATANAVGERLARLAEQHQVMVVTHSPQVAALAAHHLVVSKAGGMTEVVPLTGSAREEEIARMLSGAEISKEARAAAAKLMKAG